MPFGQVVIGPPGSGKTTYCYGMYQFLTALDRPVSIVNLDPANERILYPCAVNIHDLITLQDVMEEFGLGPNGAMLYCMEYLLQNMDWLEERLAKLGKGAYVLFDVAGQVELSTNHPALKMIVERLQKLDFRLVAVHLTDAHYVTDASKYTSVLLLSLRTMLQLELPHVNVLSKIDILSQYGELAFNLDYYTEVQDLSYLQMELEKDPHAKRFRDLNRAICEIVEDFGLVGFETLAVEDKLSMMRLLRTLDKATGYAFSTPALTPPSASSPPDASAAAAVKDPTTINSAALFSVADSSIATWGEIGHVQERWLDEKETWDEWERRQWEAEGEQAARRATEEARRARLEELAREKRNEAGEAKEMGRNVEGRTDDGQAWKHGPEGRTGSATTATSRPERGDSGVSYDFHTI